MSKLSLAILVYLSSLIVFIESKTCFGKYDCDSDQCCYSGTCYDSGSTICILSREIHTKSCTYNFECTSGCCYLGRCRPKYSYGCSSSKVCYDDSNCVDGCCVGFECKPQYSFHCTKPTKKTCVSYLDCDGYCWDNECIPYTETTFTPRIATTAKPNECSSTLDCLYDCCVDGNCVECPTDEQPTTDEFPWKFNPPTVPPLPDEDNNLHNNHKSSRGYNTGTIVGISIGSFVLLTIKVLYWVAWCSRHRRRTVLVQCNVRRTACVRREVPATILQRDHLQREHGQGTYGVPQGLPSGPPPAYTPRAEPNTHEDATQNASQDPNNPHEEGRTNLLYGVPLGPPPEYSPPVASSVSAGESTTVITGDNLAQAEQPSGEGTVNPLYGVPQGPSMGPPREYPPAIAPSASENTMPNPAQTDLVQLAEQTRNCHEPPPNYSQ